jgi:hypothetical protein
MPQDKPLDFKQLPKTPIFPQGKTCHTHGENIAARPTSTYPSLAGGASSCEPHHSKVFRRRDALN